MARVRFGYGEMILDPHTLTVWQACKRRSALEASWRPIKWRAKSLFDALLCRAIFSLSNAGDPATLAADAKAQFLSTAANPGLDLPPGANPYVIARTWCGMFDTILAAIAKTTLLVVRELPPVGLSSDVTWQPRSWQDESGQLHRWLTVDAWDDGQMSREMHSWKTIGDIAAMRAPIMLHVIEIGRATKDGRSAPWSRAWQHPGLRSMHYRFRKPTGGQLSAGWLPYYYSDVRDDAVEWAESMIREGELARITHHLAVQSPTAEQAGAVIRDVLAESRDIVRQGTVPWQDIPMSRAACDGFVPCPFEYLCYAEPGVRPESLGLYQRRSQDTLSVKEGR